MTVNLNVEGFSEIIPKKEEKLSEIKDKSKVLFELSERYGESDKVSDIFDTINNAMDNMADIAEEIEDEDFLNESLMVYVNEVDSFLDLKIEKYKEQLAIERNKAMSALKQRSELITKDLENNKQIKASEVAIENSIKTNDLLKEVLKEMEEEEAAKRGADKK